MECSIRSQLLEQRVRLGIFLAVWILIQAVMFEKLLDFHRCFRSKFPIPVANSFGGTEHNGWVVSSSGGRLFSVSTVRNKATPFAYRRMGTARSILQSTMSAVSSKNFDQIRVSKMTVCPSPSINELYGRWTASSTQSTEIPKSWIKLGELVN